MLSVRGSTSLLVATFVLASATAYADESSDALFREGRSLLADGKAAEACDRFAQAIRLDPTASGTMLNLGLCNEVLGRLKTALVWFRRAQIRATEHREDDIDREARDRMIRLTNRVPTVSVAISDPSVAVRVEIDGMVVPATDYGRVEVDPGSHVLEARADGYRTVHLRFDAKENAAMQLDVPLVRAVASGAGRRSRLALSLTIGGGVMWLGALGLAAYEKYEVYDPARDAYATSRDPDDRDRANRARAIVMYGSTGMFAAGTIALGVATYLWLRKDDEPSTMVAPTVGGGAVGIAIGGAL